MACEEIKVGQIKWFYKNKIDLENVDGKITATDLIADNSGQEFVNFMRNRNNYSAWLTTGSTDAANTELLVEFGDGRFLDNILLILHNLKAYTIQYKNGISAWQNFSTPINETNSTDSSTTHTFDLITATDLRIIIYGTQIPDTDKIITQLIATQLIGQFEGWPVVKKAMVSTNKRKSKMLSGKTRIVESLETFSCGLDVRQWRIQEDNDILEEIYFKREGVLMYINASHPEQFFLDIKGYRKEDIFLVRPTDDFKAEFTKGLYDAGLKRSIKFAEVIT